MVRIAKEVDAASPLPPPTMVRIAQPEDAASPLPPPVAPAVDPTTNLVESLRQLGVGGTPEERALLDDTVTHTLHEWLRSFDAERNDYASVSVFAETKIRQALVVTGGIGLPNAFRTAAVCSCFDSVASLFHRYEELLGTLRGELLRAIYVDYAPGTGSAAAAGGGAVAYSSLTPYFEELRRERRRSAELQMQVDQWGRERTEALGAAEARRQQFEALTDQLSEAVEDNSESEEKLAELLPAMLTAMEARRATALPPRAAALRGRL